MNKFFVGVRGDNNLVIHNIGLLVRPLSPDNALNLAAWLVLLARGNTSKSFIEVLEEGLEAEA